MKIIICLTFLFAVGYSSPQDPRCSEAKVIGPCRAAIPRFFFDVTTSTCKPFFYGGCHGNGNNFKSMQECRQTCAADAMSTTQVPEANVRSLPDPAQEDPACLQDKEIGPCRGAHPRFFFNKETRRCELFLFGGCDGNANNFRSKEQCEATCDPEASVRSPAPPRAPWCGTAVPGACNQPKVTGPCRAALRRFFFNQESGQCETFIYGGCDGNENNFKTEQECSNVCGGAASSTTQAPAVAAPAAAGVSRVRVLEVVPDEEVTIDEDVCSLGADTGPCYGFFPRYFHNKNTGRCEEFIFGGCHGNDNNFKTVQECESMCGNHVDDVNERRELDDDQVNHQDAVAICSLPSDDGGCRAAFPMYYYNKESASCEEFIYGGCKGNDNRFPTKESCDQFCKAAMQ